MYMICLLSCNVTLYTSLQYRMKGIQASVSSPSWRSSSSLSNAKKKIKSASPLTQAIILSFLHLLLLLVFVWQVIFLSFLSLFFTYISYETRSVSSPFTGYQIFSCFLHHHLLDPYCKALLFISCFRRYRRRCCYHLPESRWEQQSGDAIAESFYSFFLVACQELIVASWTWSSRSVFLFFFTPWCWMATWQW